MAAGTPVVATDIAGTREIIRHEQNGWLVPPADAAALAQAIRDALENETARERFAGRAREDVQAFSIGAIAAGHEKIYAALRPG